MRITRGMEYSSEIGLCRLSRLVFEQSIASHTVGVPSIRIAKQLHAVVSVINECKYSKHTSELSSLFEWYDKLSELKDRVCSKYTFKQQIKRALDILIRRLKEVADSPACGLFAMEILCGDLLKPNGEKYSRYYINKIVSCLAKRISLDRVKSATTRSKRLGVGYYYDLRLVKEGGHKVWYFSFNKQNADRFFSFQQKRKEKRFSKSFFTEIRKQVDDDGDDGCLEVFGVENCNRIGVVASPATLVNNYVKDLYNEGGVGGRMPDSPLLDFLKSCGYTADNYPSQVKLYKRATGP